jgi:hypothetical protein
VLVGTGTCGVARPALDAEEEPSILCFKGEVEIRGGGVNKGYLRDIQRG